MKGLIAEKEVNSSDDPDSSVHKKRSKIKAHSLLSFVRTVPLMFCLLCIVPSSLAWAVYSYNRMLKSLEKEKNMKISFIEYKLQSETERVISFIQNQRKTVEERTKKEIKEHVDQAVTMARYLYSTYSKQLSHEQISKLVREALRPARFFSGRGYFFAINFDGTEELFAANPALEGQNLSSWQDTNGKYVIKDLLRIAQEQGESFYEYTWTKPDSLGNNHKKIAYVKAVPELRWVIGTGEYPEDVEQDIKKEILSYLKTLTIDDAGYIFGGTWDGLSLLGPMIGQSMLETQDTNGIYIVKELIEAAKSGGDFVHYVMPKFDGVKPLPKLSYAAGLPEWEWYLGYGVYIDEIDVEVLAVKEKYNTEILMMFLLVAIIIVLSILLTQLISNRLSRSFKKAHSLFVSYFSDSVFKNERLNPEAVSISEYRMLVPQINEMVEKRSQLDSSLKNALEEKSILLKELHHRVKNNFQVSISLFRLQSDRSNNPCIQSAMKQACDRLYTMAAVHELLYQNASISNINLAQYIKVISMNIVSGIERPIQMQPPIIQIPPDIELSPEQAIPIGMILNEFLTNTVKHVASIKKATISITASIEDQRIHLRYTDDGPGLPITNTNNGIGMELVSALSKQAGASLSFGPSQGFSCDIIFKIRHS